MSSRIAEAVYAAAGFCSDVEQGRELGVPPCCRLLFAFQWALFPDYPQAVKRGICFNRQGIEWIPCGIFHHATVTHAEYERRLDRWKR